MKQIFFSVVFAFALISCKNDKQETMVENIDKTEEVEITYKTYGAEVSDSEYVDARKLMEVYKNISVGDTIDIKIIGEVKEVCKNKGCWMRIELPDASETMVRFKDYGFYMPEGIEGKQVIAEGKAFIEEQSVDAQRHYAEDGGASAEEVLAITEPKLIYTFIAHGVLVPES